MYTLVLFFFSVLVLLNTNLNLYIFSSKSIVDLCCFGHLSPTTTLQHTCLLIVSKFFITFDVLSSSDANYIMTNCCRLWLNEMQCSKQTQRDYHVLGKRIVSCIQAPLINILRCLLNIIIVPMSKRVHGSSFMNFLLF